MYSYSQKYSDIGTIYILYLYSYLEYLNFFTVFLNKIYVKK